MIDEDGRASRVPQLNILNLSLSSRDVFGLTTDMLRHNVLRFDKREKA